MKWCKLSQCLVITSTNNQERNRESTAVISRSIEIYPPLMWRGGETAPPCGSWRRCQTPSADKAATCGITTTGKRWQLHGHPDCQSAFRSTRTTVKTSKSIPSDLVMLIGMSALLHPAQQAFFQTKYFDLSQSCSRSTSAIIIGTMAPFYSGTTLQYQDSLKQLNILTPVLFRTATCKYLP